MSHWTETATGDFYQQSLRLMSTHKAEVPQLKIKPDMMQIWYTKSEYFSIFVPNFLS